MAVIWVWGLGLGRSGELGQTNAIRENFPPLPPLTSPVDFFRDLLLMRPEERAAALSNRAPEVRERLLAKVREYEQLSPEERELRLRATELRWYLVPLMRLVPDQRPPVAQAVPSHLRQAVLDRLAVWDRLPESVRAEFLRDELALNYFSRVPPLSEGGGRERAVFVKTGDATGTPMLESRERELRSVLREFRRIFEWTAEERQKALSTLTETERRQMEESLRQYEKLSREQRRMVIASFERLATMSPGERREFLQNAERWSAMSPWERERWRRLVRQVPELPPLPPGFYESLPPPLPPGAEEGLPAGTGTRSP